MTGISCDNCGHQIETDDQLAEMGFAWLDEEHTASRVSCPNCGIITMQRAWSFNEFKRPYAGEFLIIRPYNTIRRSKPKCQPERTPTK